MRSGIYLIAVGATLWSGCSHKQEISQAEVNSLKACVEMASGGFLPIAETRDRRFLAKVEEATARCRGGAAILPLRMTPWVDWANYWGAGDYHSRIPGILTKAGTLSPVERGILGALMDLEYERVELIKFNLFDNSGT